MLNFLESFNSLYLKKEGDSKKWYDEGYYCRKFEKNGHLQNDLFPNVTLAYEANLLVQDYWNNILAAIWRYFSPDCSTDILNKNSFLFPEPQLQNASVLKMPCISFKILPERNHFLGRFRT